MAYTANVVDGQIILAAWGNEIRDRSLQVFATPAERDSQWAAPPNGAQCVTLDTYTLWTRQAGAWVIRGPRAFNAAQAPKQLGTAAGTYDIATLTLPNLGYAQLVAITAFAEAASDSGIVKATFDLQRFSDSAITVASGVQTAGGAGQWVNATVTELWTMAAGGAASFKARTTISSTGGTFYASARLSALVIPQ